MIYIAFLFFTFLILFFAYWQWKNHIKDKFNNNFEILSITNDDGVELEGLIYEPVGFNSTILLFENTKDKLLNVTKELLVKHSNDRVILFESHSKADEIIISKMVKKHYGNLDGV